jgi:hypothetical protein
MPDSRNCWIAKIGARDPGGAKGGRGTGESGRTAFAPAAAGRTNRQLADEELMSEVPTRLHRLVLLRAGARYEYYGLSQGGQEASFHVDHNVPKASDRVLIFE